MARLGELLVQLELISDAQLHEGLATQVLYGGRLGTNLVELGHVTLDQLAKALARRHRLPAALGQHFDRCDPAMQARLPPAIAGKWRVVPIGRLAQDQRRVAVAVRDPLPEHARGELAFQLDLEPEELVCAVAPELRIHYHLELAYQIPRANRFLRVKARVPTELPVVPESVDNTDLEGWAFRPGQGGAPGTLARPGAPAAEARPGPLGVATERVPPPPASDPALKLDSQVGLPRPTLTPAARREREPEAAAADEVAVESEVDQGAERRHFVPSLADTPTQVALARIAVRQVASESAIRPVQEVAPLRPQAPEELARAVRRAETRDRVGELVVESLAELPGAPLDATIIFVARPPLAVGWKGFCEDGNAVIESLAVPLDQDGLVARAYAGRSTILVEPTTRSVTMIDQRMWELLGGLPPAQVMIAPISIGDQVVCLLYVHTRAGLGPAEALVTSLAEAAGIAFGRLLRAAQR